MITLPASQLEEILTEEGIISQDEFDNILKEAQRKNQNLVELLISKGYLTEDFYFELLAKILDVKKVKLKGTNIDPEIFNIIPQEIAQKYKVVPFKEESDGSLDVGMENPVDLETIDFISRSLNKKINPYLVSDSDIQWAFSLTQKKSAKNFERLIKENIKTSLKTAAKKGNLEDVAKDIPIVAIVDNLISYAFSLGASDVHLEPMASEFLVRFRIDGILHEMMRIPKEIQPAIIARIKLLSGLRMDEHAKPQDGRFRYQLQEGSLDMRVSVVPTLYGEKIVIRLLAAAQKPYSFEEVGMDTETAEIVSRNIKSSYGMILVCGPTGSGKTTTLYSILNALNRTEVNIITIEDPVEYGIPYVNQIQVNQRAGLTFASGLRSILRQDPDIIMVGEIRDKETAEIAVQAALTGHLVLSSLHTNNAPAAIPRLRDMGIPPFLIAAVLNVVIAQRLVRRIHRDCIESYLVTDEVKENIRKELKNQGLDENRKIPNRFYRGKGCVACNFTGYSGRVGIFETLDVNDEIKKLIVSPDFSLNKLKLLARKNGMKTMFEDGLLKVERGITTIEEVMRVIRT